MRKIIILLFVFIVTFSCKLFETHKDENIENSSGMLSLFFDVDSETRTVLPVIIPSYYTIQFVSGPQEMSSQDVSVNNPVLSLPIGEWSINIEAKDSDGNILASGSKSNIVIEGNITTNINITLVASASDSGSMDITVIWPSDQNINIVEATLNDSPITVDNTTLGVNQVNYSMELSSGNYLLVLKLYDETLLKCIVVESIRVYDNLTSSKEIILSDFHFTTLPSDPDNLIANEGLNSINVTWNDNSYVETGYIIERRIEGDADFTVLNSSLTFNSNHYNDTDIEQNVIYEYRVKAFNSVGESGYSTIASSSLIIPDVTGLESDETPTQSKSFTWESSDETATFRFLINNISTAPEDWTGATWSETTSTAYDTNSGTFYLHVQSADVAGNLSDVNTVSFVLDNTSPQIIGLTNEISPVQSYTWEWSSDDVTAQYKSIISESVDEPSDWTTIEWADTTTATVDSGDGNFYIYIITKDTLGNESTIYTGSANLDNTAPDSPTITGVTPTYSTTPTWDWNDVDTASHYRCGYSDGVWITESLESSQFTPSDPLAEGIHSLYVQACDSAGNWSTSNQFPIEIDTTLPDMPVVSGVSVTNNTTPEWSWGAVNDAVAYRYGFNENSWITESTTNLSYVPNSALDDGDHTLYVQSQDEAGNWSTSGFKLINVDTIAPEAPVVTGVTPTTDTTPTWTWTLAEDIVEIKYEISSNPTNWVAADNSTLAYTSSELTDGNYTLYVLGRDLAGNWSTTGEFVINVDTTAPYVGFMDESVWVNSSINMNPAYSDAHDITFLWEEVGSTGYVSFDDVTDPYTAVSGLDGEEGTYQLRLTATDVLGYSGSATFNLMWDRKGPAPGNSGTISSSVVSADTISLSWSEASDLSSDSANSTYKLVGSTNNNISTISDAELETDRRFVVQDWVGGYNSDSVSGLSTGETYYFNVLVKDNYGNISIYNTVSQSLTGAAGITISTNRPWEESITFNKADGEVVNQTGTYTVSVNETFDSYSWELSGMDLSSETNSSISIDCSTLNPGIHTLFSITGKNGELFSNSISFVVEN